MRSYDAVGLASISPAGCRELSATTNAAGEFDSPRLRNSAIHNCCVARHPPHAKRRWKHAELVLIGFFQRGSARYELRRELPERDDEFAPLRRKRGAPFVFDEHPEVAHQQPGRDRRQHAGKVK
jgi:hypothetical protein